MHPTRYEPVVSTRPRKLPEIPVPAREDTLYAVDTNRLHREYPSLYNNTIGRQALDNCQCLPAQSEGAGNVTPKQH